MMPFNIVWGITRRFHLLSPTNGYVAHALLTLSPVAGMYCYTRCPSTCMC